MPNESVSINYINDLLNFIDHIKKIIPSKNKCKTSYFIILNMNILLYSYLLNQWYGSIINSNVILLITIFILWCFNVLTSKLYKKYEKYDKIINDDINFLHKLSKKETFAIEKIKTDTKIMNKIITDISKYVHLILIIKVSYIIMIAISFISMIIVAINLSH